MHSFVDADLLRMPLENQSPLGLLVHIPVLIISLGKLSTFFFLYWCIFFNVYLYLVRMSGGGAEREGDTESEAGSSSELSAQSPMLGSNS